MANNTDPDQKPTDLDLHCLQRQGISGFSRTRVKGNGYASYSQRKEFAISGSKYFNFRVAPIF